MVVILMDVSFKEKSKVVIMLAEFALTPNHILKIVTLL